MPKLSLEASANLVAVNTEIQRGKVVYYEIVDIFYNRSVRTTIAEAVSFSCDLIDMQRIVLLSLLFSLGKSFIGWYCRSIGQ